MSNKHSNLRSISSIAGKKFERIDCNGLNKPKVIEPKVITGVAPVEEIYQPKYTYFDGSKAITKERQSFISG
jgi:hypothetical protein